MSEFTTEQYLRSLVNCKTKLARYLTEKGVPSDKGELYNSLVEKVKDITSSDTVGLSYGEVVLVEDRDTFTLRGLKSLPTAFGISCESVITDRLSETGRIYIALFCYNPNEERVMFYKYMDDDTFVYDKVATDLVYRTDQTEDGLYSISISFAELNEMTMKPYYFKGGYEYNWVASEKELFL